MHSFGFGIVTLIIALLASPALLILDEPFMGLDVVGRREVAALLGGLVAAGQRMFRSVNRVLLN